MAVVILGCDTYFPNSPEILEFVKGCRLDKFLFTLCDETERYRALAFEEVVKMTSEFLKSEECDQAAEAQRFFKALLGPAHGHKAYYTQLLDAFHDAGLLLFRKGAVQTSSRRTSTRFLVEFKDAKGEVMDTRTYKSIKDVSVAVGLPAERLYKLIAAA